MGNLDMTSISNLMSNNIFAQYITAFLLLILGYIAAKIIASICKKLIKKATFLNRFFEITDVKFSVDKLASLLSILLFYIIQISFYRVCAHSEFAAEGVGPAT